MSEPLQDRVVAAIGHQYELETEIGRGGMSVVYRARDLRLNRPVAVKVLPPELAYDPAIRTRFTREAQTSAQLSHAHIVPIYDVGERDGLAYLVMALIPGGNLGALLAREPRQPIAEVRRLLCEIADALAYAHLRGVIHRDIKPDNILLDRDSGRAMVTDFGIARAVEAGTRLTLTGIAVGTPTYMSPEQASGEREIDGRSDIYSLGVVGYQMLTGRVPFAAGNSMALLLKHLSEPPRPITELRPDVPRPLREAIERALAKAPEDRWPTALALRDALSSDQLPGMSWRMEHRDQGRETSARPEPQRQDASPMPHRERVAPLSMEIRSQPPVPLSTPDSIVLEQPHLAALTPEQRFDLRIWHGWVNLKDRIKAMRRYTWYSLGMTGLGVTGFVVAIAEGVPPFILSPIVPGYMWVKWWRRANSLRASGLRLRRVLLMPRAKMVIPGPPPPPDERYLEKLAPRPVLDSPYGDAIRAAAKERIALLDIINKLPKSDRAMLPDLAPTVNSLVQRVAELAQILHRLDESIDPRQLTSLDAQIERVRPESDTPEGKRRLELLQRQRDKLQELMQRREAIARQLESAGLALGNLRLDLIKVRSAGGHAAISEVSNATQEARALSREIGMVLEAVAEVKRL